MKKTLLKNYTSKVGSGSTPRGGKNSYHETGTTFVRSQNVLNLNFSKDGLVFINDEQSKKLSNVEVKINDILMNITGDSIARTCMIPQELLPARVSQHVSIIRANSNIDSQYLLYLLHNLKPYLMKICSVGGTRDALTKDMIENLEIYINYNQTEQKKIGSFLAQIDYRIKINFQIIEKLENITKDIFNHWFLQFNFPSVDGNAYKDSNGKLSFSQILKKQIPEKWEAKNLSYLIKDSSNGEWGEEKDSIEYPNRVFCLRGADINGLNGKDEFDPPIRYIKNKSTKSMLSQNDLIIEISGGSPSQSTGRISYISDKVLKRFNSPIICSNFCRKITLKDPNLVYYFFNYWELIYKSNIFFNFEGKTSGIKNLLFDLLINTIKIPVPDNKTLEKFNKICKDLEKQKQMRIIENKELAKMRDWLIPLLYNEQVKIN
jgi:type I restriction enzyme S subunit